MPRARRSPTCSSISIAQFPGFRFRVIDEQDRVRRHILLFVGEERCEDLAMSRARPPSNCRNLLKISRLIQTRRNWLRRKSEEMPVTVFRFCKLLKRLVFIP